MDIEFNFEVPSAPISIFKVPTKLQNAFDFNSHTPETDLLRDTVPNKNDNKYKGLN